MEANGNSARRQNVSDEVLDARYFKALDRFDIRFARTIWVFDNVRPGSDVLHLGCGPGMLALLKRKGVTLTGVDASPDFALSARRNGYDATFQANLSSLPFADATFDYVVSLDALNVLTAEEQQHTLAELKRVLRPGGVTLHGMECVHSESDTQQISRFLEFFQHVAYEPRYALCSSVEDFLEPAENAGSYEADFLEYVRGLSQKERRAFDIAMGYVFSKISDLGVAEPNSGQSILLKASDAPIGSFYNEHRDRRALFASDWTGITSSGLCLDRRGEVVFDDGWYAPAMLPPIARWMGRQGCIRFRSPGVEAISLDLITQLPELQAKPLGLELLLNGVRLAAFSLYKYGWLEVRALLPEGLSSQTSGEFELEIRADRTWRPRLAHDETRDDREISVAVCNLEIFA
jgi:SAM-dependent methyltransferase